MLSFGLLGYPLGHSFSKTYFTEKFKTKGIKAEFVNFELEDISHMMQIIQDTPDLKGLAVTIPYKEKIIPYLNDISDEAKTIGSVNSVKIEHRASGPFLIGYNTDVLGFRDSLSQFLPHLPEQALLLGTGGASKAVKHALLSLGVKVITVSRTPQREGEISYTGMTPFIDTSHLIVNTTPLGMWPNGENCPDIPYEKLTSSHYLFDLIYNPEITEFMKRGLQQGAKIHNGLQMLYLQADYSWNIWNDITKKRT